MHMLNNASIHVIRVHLPDTPLLQVLGRFRDTILNFYYASPVEINGIITLVYSTVHGTLSSPNLQHLDKLEIHCSR